jgi:hypothetical protein
MSETRDFTYYAEKAERQLQYSLGRDENGQRTYSSDEAKTRYVMRAHVYALLASGAAKAEPEPESRSNFFYFVNGERVEGERCFGQRFANSLVDPAKSQCVRRNGHDGDHKTADGTHFENEE